MGTMGDDEPYRMRITTAGNVAAYARFALSFLQEHPSRPLVLHTLPPDDDGGKSEEVGKSGLHSATLAAPRLVSVVEKVKREYIASLPPAQAGEKRGLWQYTETGLLPSPPAERPSLERILSGKTKPKMTHRPFLRITLSTHPLGLEKGRNVTCQVTLVPRRRGARGRGKGRDAEDDEGAEGADQGEGAREPDSGIPVPRPAHKRKSDATAAPTAKRVRTAA